VRGQAAAKRALEVAAAGAHSLLLVGPPGTGKSMLAQRLPGLLPPMTDDEALQAALASLAGATSDRHPRGLRHRAVRRLHRAVERQGGEELQHAGVQAQGAEVTTIEGLAAPTARCTRCRPPSAPATACSAASAPRAW
jgi:predicted ATPase with chaperone activity